MYQHPFLDRLPDLRLRWTHSIHCELTQRQVTRKEEEEWEEEEEKGGRGGEGEEAVGEEERGNVGYTSAKITMILLLITYP